MLRSGAVKIPHRASVLLITRAGLPDRIFSYQNKKIGTVLKALEDNFWYLS
jgi:hypothetical protein